MQNLLNFLNSQRVMVLATHTHEPTPHPWVSNVYYVADEDSNIYFFGGTKHKWVEDILENPSVAFSVVLDNQEGTLDRKGIQGVGEASLADHDLHLERALARYHNTFPALREKISEEGVKSGRSNIFILKPKFIKYTDDSLYGEEKANSFEF